MTTYNRLFTDRNHSIYLIPGNSTIGDRVSKIGGAAPKFFDDLQNELKDYYYYLTVADPKLEEALGTDSAISVFIAKDFSPFGEHTEFPDFKIKCIRHPLSEYRSVEIDSFPSIKETTLSLVTDGAVEPYLVKIGGHPDFVQEEVNVHDKLLDNGFSFLFQIDDNGLTEDILEGDYPFGYGALYVYARFNHGKIDDIVAGFTQF